MTAILGREADGRRSLVALAAIALAVLLARGQTFGNPVLGFDEQFFLLAADRMLDGALPYVDIWDRKPIGLFLIFALAILPGGDPFLNYKLIAAAAVAGTSFAIYCGARREAGPVGALAAALLYPFWLNFMEGEGGAAAVFYNLPVVLAALTVRRVTRRRAAPEAAGLIAMLLAGIAIQIKYTAVFEGLFLGVVLMIEGRRAWGISGRLLRWTLAWAAAALVPTMLPWAWYAAIGQNKAFVFANFLSQFGRLSDAWMIRLGGLALIVLVVLPLAAVAVLASRRQRIGFDQQWALAATLSVLGFGAYLSPGYAMPMIPPLLLCAAPWFARSRRGLVTAAGLLVLAAIGGGLLVRTVMHGKGMRPEAMRIADAARPRQGGCIWVWDGYPALYLLTRSCVPTRWPFPGHLNTQNEASARAIGVDPQAEVRRILATRPEAIIDDYPPYHLGNRATRALVQAELARSYRLVARVETGQGRFRLVYRAN
ncbi:MAG: glycosyltransferase family 39 protein [Pseudomonadota bacterium]